MAAQQDDLTRETFAIRLAEIYRAATLLGLRKDAKLIFRTPQNAPGSRILDWDTDLSGNTLTIWFGA